MHARRVGPQRPQRRRVRPGWCAWRRGRLEGAVDDGVGGAAARTWDGPDSMSVKGSTMPSSSERGTTGSPLQSPLPSPVSLPASPRRPLTSSTAAALKMREAREARHAGEPKVEAERLLRLAAGLRERVDGERRAMAAEMERVRGEAQERVDEARREAEGAVREAERVRREASAEVEAMQGEMGRLRAEWAEADAIRGQSEAALVEVLGDMGRKEDAAVLRMAEAALAEDAEDAEDSGGRRWASEVRRSMLSRLVGFLHRVGDRPLLPEPSSRGEGGGEESEESKAERLRYVRFRVFLVLYNAFRRVSRSGDCGVEDEDDEAEALPAGDDAALASAPLAPLAEALASSPELRALMCVQGPRNYRAWDEFREDVDEGIEWVVSDAEAAPPGAHIRWGSLMAYFAEGVQLRRRELAAVVGGASQSQGNSVWRDGIKFTHRGLQTDLDTGHDHWRVPWPT